MPGPNSAPNGDAGLVRGHEQERFVYCKECYAARKAWGLREFGVILDPIKYPARSHDAKHGRLTTGKTALDKARKSR